MGKKKESSFNGLDFEHMQLLYVFKADQKMGENKVVANKNRHLSL